MTTADRSDEELELAWRQGSQPAFAQLFRRYYARVVGYATRYVGDHATAEDLVQQAFLNLFQRRHGQGRFRALVYTCVRNLAFNERRRQGRRSAPQPLEQPPAGAGVGGLDALVHAEQHAAFGRALDALPEDEREAFCLKEIEGLTYKEVGEVMDLHPDAVRRRVGKALLSLRRSLEES
ncbi:MAG: sigma-70 family RNA polymerase sigma factor [Planctomycetes bacterium]|nr:sigma-70 family RNA polymerase sigma factor [Planctomycetota bacterium]